MTQLALRQLDELPGRSDDAERVRLFDLSIGLVEDIHSGSSISHGTPGYSPQFQLAFPYRGFFVWHVGGDEVVGDANQAIFVAGGEEYWLDQPLESGFSELMFTPSSEVLAELMGSGDRALGARTAFRQRSRRVDPALQSFRSRFLGWARSGAAEDSLAAEELVLSLVRATLVGHGPFHVPRSPQRLLRRTKEFLEAELGRPIKLAEIGRMVGASPTYLTHLFRAVEGIPLHRYLTQLRLARALVELPHATDLTALALELGFSSHSHFSAAFRRVFGCTPSAFRDGLGRPPRPLAVSAGATSPPGAPAPLRRAAR